MPARRPRRRASSRAGRARSRRGRARRPRPAAARRAARGACQAMPAQLAFALQHGEVEADRVADHDASPMLRGKLRPDRGESAARRRSLASSMPWMAVAARGIGSPGCTRRRQALSGVERVRRRCARPRPRRRRALRGVEPGRLRVDDHRVERRSAASALAGGDHGTSSPTGCLRASSARAGPQLLARRRRASMRLRQLLMDVAHRHLEIVLDGRRIARRAASCGSASGRNSSSRTARGCPWRAWADAGRSARAGAASSRARFAPRRLRSGRRHRIAVEDRESERAQRVELPELIAVARAGAARLRPARRPWPARADRRASATRSTASMNSGSPNRTLA